MIKYKQIQAATIAGAVEIFLNSRFVVDLDGTATEQLFEVVQAAALEFANAWAGAKRREHFTDITAQDSVYLDKEQEARRCLADTEPTAEAYPYCEIERGIIEAALGQPADLHTAAGFIVQVADEKRALSVAIEARRRRVGAAVAAAQSVEAIEAALAGLDA